MKTNQNTGLYQYKAGLRAGAPVIFGYLPVSIAYGIMARQAGFTLWQSCAMSLFVYAGASEMMAVGMCVQGAGTAAIVLATFLLNLRHMIMSTYVMNRVRKDRLFLKLLAAFGITDEAFAVFSAAGEEHSSAFYVLGIVTVTYGSWNLGTLIGAASSDFLPEIVTASLGIALYAMFIGLLIPMAQGSRELLILVLMTAVCNALLSRLIPASWALIASTLLCAFAGVFFVDLEEEKVSGQTAQASSKETRAHGS